MKRVFGIVSNILDIYLVNYRILLAVIGIAVVNYISMTEQFEYAGDTLLSYVYCVAGMNLYPMISVVLCMWAYGYTFYEEYRYKHIDSIFTRTDLKLYTFVKIATSIIITVIVNTLGNVIMLICFCLRQPMNNTGNLEMGGFCEVIDKVGVIPFILLITIFNSLFIATFLVIAEICALLFDNLFFAYMSPLIFFYLLINIENYIRLPRYTLPMSVYFFNGIGIFENYIVGFLYGVGYIFILSTVLTVIFVNKKNYIKRCYR